ncbi:hypothetical protein ACSQ67_019440 [Phaseolus vulgaris]
MFPIGATNLSTLASSGPSFIHHFNFASCVMYCLFVAAHRTGKGEENGPYLYSFYKRFQAFLLFMIRVAIPATIGVHTPQSGTGPRVSRAPSEVRIILRIHYIRGRLEYQCFLPAKARS